MLKKINKKKICKILFFIFFVISIQNVKNYGISWDEQSSRAIGFINAKYIVDKFSQFLPILQIDKNVKLKYSKNYKNYDLKNYPERAYGPSFELPAAILEYFFDFNEDYEIFLFRHYFNFIIFFISSIFFFRFVLIKFKSYNLALASWLLYVFTPRIFAESFYNSKDVIFMSYMVISHYFGYLFIKKDKFKNILLFSFFTALSTALRPIGIINLFFYLFFFILKKKKIILSKIFLLSFITILFTYCFWPYLWEFSPYKIYNAAEYFSKIPWNKQTLFLGNFIYANELPWYYLPLWLLLTIPEVVFFFILISFLFLLVKKDFENFLYFLYFIIPLTLVMIFRPVQFDGWRHFYFIYPIIIIFSISFFQYLNKKSQFLFILLLIFYNIHLVFWNYKNNPYQFLYFNNLFNKQFINKFEQDYWGLTNKFLIEYVNKRFDHKIYYKAYNSNFDLSLKILKKIDQKKFIKITDDKSKKDNYFIFINNRFMQPEDIESLRKNTIIIKEIFFNDIFINGVYLKR